MATAAISPPEPYRAVVKVRHFPEAASQTFVKGDVLILATASDKGHQCKIAGADPTAGILGVAAKASTGVEGTDIDVFSTEDNTFIANIEGSVSLDNDMTGLACGLVTTTGAVRVDTSDTTNKNVRITQLIDVAGTVSGRVEFVFLNTSAAFGR